MRGRIIFPINLNNYPFRYLKGELVMITKTKMTSDYDPLIGVGVGFQRIRRITG